MDLPIIFKNTETGRVTEIELMGDPRDEFIRQYNDLAYLNGSKILAEKPPLPSSCGMKAESSEVLSEWNDLVASRTGCTS